MDEHLVPEDAFLRAIAPETLKEWLPSGESILVRRCGTKITPHPAKLETWSRDFLLARLSADGVFDCSQIPHPEGFPLCSKTRDGSRLWVQARRPEVAHG